MFRLSSYPPLSNRVRLSIPVGMGEMPSAGSIDQSDPIWNQVWIGRRCGSKSFRELCHDLLMKARWMRTNFDGICRTPPTIITVLETVDNFKSTWIHCGSCPRFHRGSGRESLERDVTEYHSVMYPSLLIFLLCSYCTVCSVRTVVLSLNVDIEQRWIGQNLSECLTID